MVAIAWALVAHSLREDPLISPHPFTALFAAVWAIYLFDRLYDTRNLVMQEDTPLRHGFTARFRILFVVLLIVASGLAISSFPFLSTPIVRGGGILAGATAAYYIVFRFFRRFPDHFLMGPWKELTIALCFSVGIFLSVFPLPFTVVTGCLGLAMSSLFFGNCLRISLAEAGYDNRHDPAGFFSSSVRRHSRAIVLPPAFAFVISVYLILRGEVLPVGLSILSTSILCFFINLNRRIPEQLVQALADLSLLIPPLAVLGLEFILTR